MSDALVHYRKLLDLQPDNMEVHNIVGTVLVQQGRVKEGAEEWEKVLSVDADNGNAMSNLAWVFATSPDQSIRNGAKAVQLAEQAVAPLGRQDSNSLPHVGSGIRREWEVLGRNPDRAARHPIGQ